MTPSPDFHDPIGAPRITLGSALPHVGARELGVLRLLGRLEFVPTNWIHRLIFPDRSYSTTARALQDLHGLGCIWQTRATMAQVDPREAGGNWQSRTPPPRQPLVWGLTPEGKEMLLANDAEHDDASYQALKVRDRRSPNVSKTKLIHDLLAAGWCAAVIDQLRRCPMVQAIRCQVEFESAHYPDTGQVKQRFDALLGVRFVPQRSRQECAGWDIPWWDDITPQEQHTTIWFALEVDRGTEKLSVLLAKGVMYRDLTHDGTYKRILGANVVPVFLVPPGKRASQIAREWQDAWPQNPGIISTPAKLNDHPFGPLMGTYYTMKDNPAQETRLLKGLIQDDQHWANLIAQWSPTTPRRGASGGSG